ncbi:MAG: hypothetical protein AB7O91_00775 [Sphingomonas sp.]
MRDEMFCRDWVENHDAFSRDLDRAFAALRVRLGHVLAWDGSVAHLAALVLSAAITALTFNATTV